MGPLTHRPHFSPPPLWAQSCVASQPQLLLTPGASHIPFDRKGRQSLGAVLLTGCHRVNEVVDTSPSPQGQGVCPRRRATQGLACTEGPVSSLPSILLII